VSDWPTALVTGLSTGVTAIAATLFGARFRLRREREQEWRRWQVEAASVLSTKLGGASDAIGYAIEVLEEEEPDPKDADKAVSDADWLVSEASLPLAHVLLFAPEESDIATAAEEAVEELRNAIKALVKLDDPDPGREDRDEILEDARAARELADDLRKNFASSVRSATRPS
jgi:hypothetical protein